MSEHSKEGASPQYTKEGEATKESVIALANRYLEIIGSYGDNDQVIASMGTMGTTLALDAGRLREFIVQVKKQIEENEVMPENAFKTLWANKLHILSPEKSKELARKIEEMISAEIKGFTEILAPKS